jgi:hypothetical protein
VKRSNFFAKTIYGFGFLCIRKGLMMFEQKRMAKNDKIGFERIVQ